MSQFTFDQKNTKVSELLTSTIALLENARMSSSVANSENIQLIFIISDGRLSNQKVLGQWIREAESKNMLIVFLIIDSPTAKDTILEVEVMNSPFLFFKGEILIESKKTEHFIFRQKSNSFSLY